MKGSAIFMMIYLMRHGQTEWNTVHRMQGRSDIPLNAVGRKQAKRAAQGMDKLPIDRILTSPLCRAKQTAQAVAVGRGIPVLIEDTLTEMAFGDLEGMLLHDFPEQESIFSDPAHYIPLGSGETYAQLDERCRQLLEEIIPPLEGRYHDVVMVSHGAFIRGVVRRILNLPLEDFWKTPPQQNCTCTLLQCTNGAVSLLEEGHIYC